MNSSHFNRFLFRKQYSIKQHVEPVMSEANQCSFKILSFGEILWDLLPDGKKMGGAPANFAYHCRQLGDDVKLVSRVGRDGLGNEILENCNKIGLSTELISQDDNLPTGTVDVRIEEGGQPVYTIVENVAWDALEITETTLNWTLHADAICFGSLAARSKKNRDSLKQLIEATPEKTLKVLDLNLRDPFCDERNIKFVLSCANILKLNDDELIRMNRLFNITETKIDDQIRKFIKRFDFKLVILTCGANGSWLATESEQVYTPGIKIDVVDAVGAGDSFTAAVVTGFLREKPLDKIGNKANELGAYVCSFQGATPSIPERFRWNDYT